MKKKLLAGLTTGLLILGMSGVANATTVGLLNTDPDDVGNVISQLVSTGKFTAADITNLGQDTSSLSNFGSILAWSNYQWNNPTAVGNALANYAQNGGGVVISTYNYSSTWGISGNILNPGNSPYQPVAPGTGGPFSGVLDMSSATHPIFNGISSISYWTNDNYTDPTLTGTQLAVDTFGNSVVAINGAQNIIGINIFAGYMAPENSMLFANALNYTANPHATPEPATMLLLGSGLAGLLGARRKKKAQA